jgi:hypothetical protein
VRSMAHSSVLARVSRNISRQAAPKVARNPVAGFPFAPFDNDRAISFQVADIGAFFGVDVVYDRSKWGLVKQRAAFAFHESLPIPEAFVNANSSVRHS